MSRVLHLKNMVCDRCKTTVLNIFKEVEISVISIELGNIVVEDFQFKKLNELENKLIKHGFELLKDENKKIIEKIKIELINKLTGLKSEEHLNLLSKTLGKSYAILSKLFSKSEGITIEKYFINLKIEKVKEHIQLNQLNFTQIAYSLNYKSSSHLAKQFKMTTGMSMTKYKELQNWNRISLDRIV